MSQSLVCRILAYLQRAEERETDFGLRDDARIAWITVLYASRGDRAPHVAATYAVLGMHPDKVWPRILANRRALLGSEFEKLYPPSTQASAPATDIGDGASSPKKPVRTVRSLDEWNEWKKKRGRDAA